MKSVQTTGRRIILLVAMATLLLLSTAAQALPGAGYRVEEGTLTGGGYRLTTISRQTGEPLSGGRYHLLPWVPSPAAGSGCCCTYLPCVLRKWRP
jgi:hypothetical protein